MALAVSVIAWTPIVGNTAGFSPAPRVWPVPPTMSSRMIAVAPGESLFVSLTRRPISPTQTVVLLTGTLGSAYSVRHLTSTLSAEGVRIVVIDLLGMGQSSRPAVADYSLTQQGERVRVVLDSVGVDHALLVALGTSATAALHLAAGHPDRVSGVVSIAGGPVDRQTTAGIGVALTFAPLLNNGVGRAVGRRKFAHAFREQSATIDWITDEVLRAYRAPFDAQLSTAMRVLQAMNAAREPVSIAQRLPSVRAPIHVLVGDKRSSSTPSDEQLRVLVRTAAHLTVDTVPQAGSLIHEEQPAAVVATILAMLRDERLRQ